MTAAELEAYLHAQIPLTVSMGVRVEECTERRVALSAPLEPNRNHLQTAFGGSLHALAVLCGYSFLWRMVDRPGCHIVVRETWMSYDRPVAGELCAVCEAPAREEIERFHHDLKRKGKARLGLTVTIAHDGDAAATLEGTFVALTSA